MRARYERAERFCEWNVRRRVRNVSVAPEWMPDGDSFIYSHQVDGGEERRLVDPRRACVETAPDALPTNTAASAPQSAGRLRSPDGRWDLVRVGNNLVVEPADGSHDPILLTSDGEADCAYGAGAQSSTFWVTQARSGLTPAPVAVWSPDSRRIVTHMLDQREVPPLHLLESRPPEGVRPVLWSYRMPFVGDALASAALVVLDIESRSVTRIDGDPLLVEWGSPLEIGWVWWGHGDDVWFLRETRGAHDLALCVANVTTGSVRTVITESDEQYVEPHPLLPWSSQVRLLPDGDHVVWSSERTGWRHLDLVDVTTGTVTRALTRGEWAVREVLGVDDEWVWFTACGREAGRDPYYRHVYRVSVSGGEPQLLTPEDADHACVLSPSGRYLLDTASTVDSAAVTRVRAADGTHVLDVVTADLSALHDDGWIPPERFTAPGADGMTPLYGVIYRPVDFDASRSYPVIDAYYPGPQLIRTPKSFTVDDNAGVDAWPGMWGPQALAELGFIVVNIDGHGTPLRSRALHHSTYGRLEDNALDDHIAVIRSLAESRPWMDVDLGIGAQGHSAGAAATVHAMLTRPDIFTVGVAGSGVYDLRRYIAYWGEKYQGLVGDADYSHQSSLDLADRLQGRLLLLHGELDDNVHPSNTLALYDAFVQADSDVDLVILAGWGHPCWTHPYYVRRMWDHFVRHLLGAEPPVGYRVTPA